MFAVWGIPCSTTAKTLWAKRAARENTMNSAPVKYAGYESIFERLVDDAGFLWLLRHRALTQAHYNRREQQSLDHRLETVLQALGTAPDAAWIPAYEAAKLGAAGEMFVASYLAFTCVAVDRIEAVLALAQSGKEHLGGLVSALGWLPADRVRPWVWSWIHSGEPAQEHLALCACSVRREDPREHLSRLLQNPANLSFVPLHARALRLIGELKRFDLLPYSQAARAAENPEIQFWSLWSGVLLGDTQAWSALQPLVMQPGPWQNAAVELAFRALPLDMGRAWISQMAQDANLRSQAIRAVGVLGDSQALPWLVQQMRDSAVAQMAGEAFTWMSGIDLISAGLAMQAQPAAVEDGLANATPVPDVIAIEQLLPQVIQRMPRGARYFLGRILDEQHTREIYASGNQQQRSVAALELALMRSEQIVLNIAMKESPSVV